METEARKLLERNGFFVANLWHVNDVMTFYNCDEESAQKILYKALTNDYIMSTIWDTINEVAKDLNIESK